MPKLSFAGVKIIINPVFFALFPAAAALGLLRELAALLCFAFLHEAAHIVTGRIEGLRLKGLNISALGLSASFEDISSAPLAKKCAVFLSGPLINLLAAFIARLLGSELIFTINTILLLFNLLPARTLDGGQILTALISRKTGYIRASRMMGVVNSATSACIIALGVMQVILFPPNIILILLGIVILIQGKKQGQFDVLSFTLNITDKPHKYTDGRKLSPRLFAVPDNTPIKALFDTLSYDTYCLFCIYDTKGALKPITEAELLTFIGKQGISGNASDIISAPPLPKKPYSGANAAALPVNAITP